MNKINEIIRRHEQSRAAVLERPQDGAYEAYTMTPGFPQMAFSIVERDGSEHLIEYYNTSHVKYRPARNGMDENVSFIYDRKVAITVTGRQLHPMLLALKEHTLVSLHEKAPEAEAADDAPVIKLVMMTDVTAPTGRIN